MSECNISIVNLLSKLILSKMMLNQTWLKSGWSAPTKIKFGKIDKSGDILSSVEYCQIFIPIRRKFLSFSLTLFLSLSLPFSLSLSLSLFLSLSLSLLLTLSLFLSLSITISLYLSILSVSLHISLSLYHRRNVCCTLLWFSIFRWHNGCLSCSSSA